MLQFSDGVISEIQHMFPPRMQPQPVEVSIVIPALNEEVTIGEFVEWCKEGLQMADVDGQILIVDSSTDGTADIALTHGAEVLRVPKRGLGRAYIDAIPYIRGKYIIMGDADLTYDFRELRPFLEEFRKGYEYVMGSRFRGSIEPGAMPALHQYFGTPLTTWILNFIYRSKFSDIHCGMRGITLEALRRINLRSQSWEYASEMVLKAVKLKLKISEVPVRFLKDREGRTSHHRRSGFLSPWIAGWINLKVMLIYSPDFFLLKPGLIMLIIGLFLSLTLVRGGYMLGRVGLDLHWMLLGVTLTTLGYNCLQVGILARIANGFQSFASDLIKCHWDYNRGVLGAGILMIIGTVLNINLIFNYIHQGMRLADISYQAIFGLLLILLGFQTFAFTLYLEMTRRQKE
jgi:glycosyltransferase involved in cell wall biosynthesis